MSAHTHNDGCTSQRPTYYDRDGAPIPQSEWIKHFNDPAYQQVTATRVGPATVSTIWLGLDFSALTDEDTGPLIFETRIAGGLLDGRCRHYGTETEARAGHDSTVDTANAVHEGWKLLAVAVKRSSGYGEITGAVEAYCQDLNRREDTLIATITPADVYRTAIVETARLGLIVDHAFHALLRSGRGQVWHWQTNPDVYKVQR